MMRGGTSKGLYFHQKDLPRNSLERDKMLLKIMGSPDPMQIDGLGGTYSSTSKIMVVWKSEKKGYDLDYLFGQVAIDQPVIDYGTNCGNLTSAVGPFGIDEKLVEAKDKETTLNLYNVNTRKKVIVKFPIKDGHTFYEGNYEIDGVPGTGSRIDCTFYDPAGTISDKSLPTGNPIDKIDTGEEKIDCSIVDVTSPYVFVRAHDVGFKGTELPNESNTNIKSLEKLERIRSVVAEMLGIVKDRKDALKKSPSSPRIAFVSPPADYKSGLDKMVKASQVNLVARALSLGKAHHAYPITGAMCTASAALLKGTVVQEIAVNIRENVVIIGHSKGIVDVSLETSKDRINSINIGRTARRLIKGEAYYIK